MLRKQSLPCEILNAVVQRLGKVFDKGTTAGGACLIQLYALYRMIAYFDALHVLAANVQNAVHIRIEEGGGCVMGDGFHLSLIQNESGLNQLFAVTGGAGTDDPGSLRHFGIDVFDRADGSPQWIPVVIVVEGVQQIPVLAHNGGLRRCGTGVYSQKAVSGIGGEIRRFYFVTALSFQKILIVFLCGKQRIHTGNLKYHLYAVAELVTQKSKGEFRILLFCVQC